MQNRKSVALGAGVCCGALPAGRGPRDGGPEGDRAVTGQRHLVSVRRRRPPVPQDLHKIGYVEEEYLASGKANVYSWPVPGPAVVRTPDAPYTTRVLVRRPANPARFSGTVIVEILNPSNAFDLNIGWGLAQRQIGADGDAWVGVIGKPISIDALKNFDPVRYGSLSMANPLALNDPRNCDPPVSFITPASCSTDS